MTSSRLADAVERANKAMRESVEQSAGGVVESQAFGPIDQTQILRLIGLNPRDPRAHAVVAVARRYGLDPVLGHIAIIPKSAMPYITRDGYLHVAHRSAQLDGIEVVDGPRREGAEWVAKVAVYRKDMTHPFIYPGRAEIGAGNGPEMAITRAERRALRRAFAVTLPAEFGDDDGTVTVPAPALAAPTSTQTDEQAPAGTDTRAEPLTDRQRAAIFAECERLGIAGRKHGPERDARLDLFTHILGRQIESTSNLTYDEASQLISALQQIEAVDRAGDAVAFRSDIDHGDDTNNTTEGGTPTHDDTDTSHTG